MIAGRLSFDINIVVSAACVTLSNIRTLGSTKKRQTDISFLSLSLTHSLTTFVVLVVRLLADFYMKVAPSQQEVIARCVKRVSEVHEFFLPVAAVRNILSADLKTLQIAIRQVAEQYVTNAPGGATVPTTPTEMESMNATTIAEIQGLAATLENSLGVINLENCRYLCDVFQSHCRPANNVQVPNTEGSQVSDLSAGSAPRAGNQG